ncbi:MAG TPA: YgaP-like transmembrane domain [Gammaproteobacteria bacterium]
MSEHTYRLVLGALMLVLLYTEYYIVAYVVIGVTLFEGLTNQRINLVVTRILRSFGADVSEYEKPPRKNYRIPFDAERAQRLFIAAAFAALFFLAPNEFWILNWFFAFGMLLSGIVMFCPVIALFRAIGFR